MKEKDITKAAKIDLDKMGAIYWVAVKRKGFEQQDIFGIFDLVYLIKHGRKKTTVGFIQLTTKHHISDRRKKIQLFFRDQKLNVPYGCWIWGYDGKTSSFTKEIIN